MRVVVALGLASTPEPYHYDMSGFTRSLASPVQSAAIQYMWALQIPICHSLPGFLASNNYSNPVEPSGPTAFNLAKDEDVSFFDYLRDHEDQNRDFAQCMIGYAGNLTPWTSIFPTEQILLCNREHNAVVVDVGGGVGHDLLHFAKKHSLPADKLILQDLPEVVHKMSSPSPFYVEAHDFFSPQPRKGLPAT